MSNLIISRRDPTQEIIEEMVDMELAYINNNHPEMQYDGLKNFLADPEKSVDPEFQKWLQQLEFVYLMEEGFEHIPFSEKDLRFDIDNNVRDKK